jgi:hypothetical protein
MEIFALIVESIIVFIKLAYVLLKLIAILYLLVIIYHTFPILVFLFVFCPAIVGNIIGFICDIAKS